MHPYRELRDGKDSRDGAVPCIPIGDLGMGRTQQPDSFHLEGL